MPTPTTSNTVTPYPSPNRGTVLTDSGYIPSGAKWSGQEVSYVEITSSSIGVTTTTDATATTIFAGTEIEYDGYPIIIEFYSPRALIGTTVIHTVLYQDGSNLGRMSTQSASGPVRVARRISPTPGPHTYSIRAFVDGGLGGAITSGAGTAGTLMPSYMRITRA
jgi:hypothetical protein